MMIIKENPNNILIVNEDIMKYECPFNFHIITMIGSTRLESGLYEEIINKAFSGQIRFP